MVDYAYRNSWGDQTHASAKAKLHTYKKWKHFRFAGKPTKTILQQQHYIAQIG